VNARERVQYFMDRPELLGLSPSRVQSLSGNRKIKLNSIRRAQKAAKQRLFAMRGGIQDEPNWEKQ